MLVAEGNGLPIGFRLASANHHEVKLAVPTLESVRVPRRRGGRPKQRPEELVADKAYDSKRFRRWLRSKEIKPTIPPYERRARKLPILGRPVKVGPGYAEPLEGGAHLRLARQLPTAVGAARALPFDLSGILLDRVHPHVAEAFLKDSFSER